MLSFQPRPLQSKIETISTSIGHQERKGQTIRKKLLQAPRSLDFHQHSDHILRRNQLVCSTTSNSTTVLIRRSNVTLNFGSQAACCSLVHRASLRFRWIVLWRSLSSDCTRRSDAKWTHVMRPFQRPGHLKWCVQAKLAQNEPIQRRLPGSKPFCPLPCQFQNSRQ